MAAWPVAGPAEGVFQQLRRGGVEEIVTDQRRPRHRVGLNDVDADDGAPLAFVRTRGVDPLGGDDGPAARRRAQVDDTVAGLEEAEAIIELDELEGGPRAEPPVAGLGDVAVGELAPQDRKSVV